MTLFTSRLLFLLLALLSTVWAQNKNIIPTSPSSSFPACGISCPTLVAAQDSCTASAPQSTWFSCFCQSSMLTPLKTSGSICSNCDSSDQALVSTWYNNYCNSGGTDTGASNAASPVAAPAPAGTSAVPSSSASPSSGKNQGWWPTHYRWVIMVIVLIVGFSAIAAIGICLKRRYDAKRPGLYHGGTETGSRSSGVMSPAPPPAWASSPASSQPMAGGSRSDMAPKAFPVMPGRSKLQRPS